MEPQRWGRLAAPFAETCEFIAFDGTHFTGRQEIAKFHAELFAKWMRGTRLVGQVERVRFLGPDAAAIYSVGGTILRNQRRPAPERNSLQTLVAQRQEGEWRLVAFHNTRLRPIGLNGASFLIWSISDWLWRLFRLNPPMDYRQAVPGQGAVGDRHELTAKGQKSPRAHG